MNLNLQRICSIAMILLTTPASRIVAQTLFELPDGVESRWASPENPKGEKGRAGLSNSGRKGSPTVSIKAGESRVLAESSGSSGTIRRIWMTFGDRSPRMLRSLRIEMYWDGASKPAVSAPLGDFFGVGLGQTAAFQSALFANPEGRSFNCFVPMPFKSGMRIVVTNDSTRNIDNLYYDVDYTLGDRHGVNTLYFHAFFRRENPTHLQKDYEILPRVEGKGRYLGANVGVVVNHTKYFSNWWGEGEVKIFLDGDQRFPTISGTGTEDYIGAGWGEGKFINAYSGSSVADEKNSRWCFYRYHIPDPIYFHTDVRVTIQQIGYLGSPGKEEIRAAGGKLYQAGPGLSEMDTSKGGIFEREDDWSSCAYFYLDRPESGLPPIEGVAKRIEGL